MISIEQEKQLEQARADGKTIGLVQGSWDLFHVGHLKYIRKAMRRCDFLVIGLDGDAKIQKRKGPSRPIIPESERHELIKELGMADTIVIKGPNEPKWGLIKAVKPDVLIAIQENYKAEDIPLLEEICGRVEILPRQSEKSTSDAVRKIIFSERTEQMDKIAKKTSVTVENMKQRLELSDEEMTQPLELLLQNLHESTDFKVPVAAGCFVDGKWYYGTNQVDLNLPDSEITERSELFYDTVEHAEINLLKKLVNIGKLDGPIYSTLFPCDKCMKVLNDKGVKEIYYLEDHPKRNWSKRAHAKADEYGIKTVPMAPRLVEKEKTAIVEVEDKEYPYIDPRNVRYEKQLQIMLDMDARGLDPLDPNVIEQEILFSTDHWYVTLNRFAYDEIEHMFMIVANEPIYEIDGMTKEMWVDLANIWSKLKKDYEISGGALCYRFGDTAYSGASLKRLHAHIIQPKTKSKTKFNIGGNPTMKPELK